MSYSRERYIMDDPREAARLRNKAGAADWVRRFLLPLLHGSERFIEVGCGPGELIHELLQAMPAIQPVGIDSSPERIAAARARNAGSLQAEFCCRDAHQFGVASSSFDLVFSRFMLEYVQDKQRVVDEMFRACRPGGKVVLQDLDGQLLWHDPAPPSLLANIEKVVASLAATGFDPFTGRKLRALALRAGFLNVQVAIEPYHLIAGAIDPVERRHWEAKLEIARPLIGEAMGSDAEAEGLMQSLLSFFDDPETLTYSILFTVTGEKP